MAQNLGALKVSLGLESAGFKQGVTDINRRLAAVKSEFTAAGDGSKEFARSLDGLQRNGESLTRQMDLQRAKVEILREEYKKMVREKGADDAATVRAVTAYNKALGAMNKLETSIRRNDDAIKNHADNIDDSTSKFEKFRDTLQRVSSFISNAFKSLASGVATAGMNVAKFGSIIAGLTTLAAPAVTGILGLGSAAVSAGAGLAGYGIVAKSVLGKVFEDTENLTAAQEKLKEAESPEERKAALKEIQAIYAGMDSEQRKAVDSLQKFKSFFSGFTDQFKKPIFAAFNNGLQFAQGALKLAQPAIQNVADAVVRLTGNLNKSLGSPEVKAMFTWFGNTAAKNLESFGRIAGNAFMGVMNLMRAFNPVAGSMTGGLERLTKKFAEWTAGLSKSEAFKQFVNWSKTNGKLLIDIFANLIGMSMNVLKAIAPIAGAVVQMVLTVTKKFTDFKKSLSDAGVGSQQFRDTINKAFDAVKKFVQPAIAAVSKYFGDKVKEMRRFWDTDGEQIKKAVENAFKFIQKIISVVMPVVLSIIKSVWGDIQHVIDGTLNIIKGAIRVFTGIFTGDWKKVWQGIKDITKGAVEAAWGIINLTFIGKIGKGIKVFGKGLVTTLKDSWKQMTSGITGFVKAADKLFMDFVKSGGKNFDKLVKAAKELPKKLGDGIGNMAKAVGGGIKKVANEMAKTLGSGINGIISGVNWVLDSVGSKTKVKKWTVPQYAKGTDSHGGGLAWLGDGKKHEAYQTPDGQWGMSPNTDTLYNLPAGTRVFSGEETEQLMAGMSQIPKFAGGGVIKKIKDTASSAWSATKSGAKAAGSAIADKAGDVKDAALDIWSYIDNPKKLWDKVAGKFVPKLASVGQWFDPMLKGGMSFVNDKIISFIKKQIGDFGGSVGAPSGAGVARWRPYILKAAAMMKEAVTPAQVNGILAQIQRESGGNEKITQSSKVVDVNTLAGNPARGLLQYIPQTFAAYAVKGHKSIYNGFDQLLAFFNNTSWRKNLPYGKRGWGPTGRRKYFSGGIADTPQFASLAENGYPEWIIPSEPRYRSNAQALLADANSKLNGGTSKGGTIQYIYNTTVKYTGSVNDRDVEALADKLEIIQKRRTTRNARKKGVILRG
jgi:SLT domain-containing protein/phage-related protein